MQNVSVNAPLVKPYKKAQPNAYDAGLIPVKTRKEYFNDYVMSTVLKPFLGHGMSAPIQLLGINRGAGDTYQVPYMRPLDYKNPIKNNEQAAGTSQQLTVLKDTVEIEQIRFVGGLRGVDMVEQILPINLYNALKPSLQQVSAKYMVWSIFKAATQELYPDTTKAGPIIDRVMYGNKDSKTSFKPTIAEGCAPLKDATYKNDGLSVDHIRRLKNMAQAGGVTYENESPITPIAASSIKNATADEYLYFIDDASYRSLASDPQWSEQVTRGVIQNTDQPNQITGARYRGMIEGVMVYVCPEIMEFRQGANKNVAWNLFIGAQAWALCIAKETWFKMEYTDIENNVEMAACEIKGQKALVYPGKQNANVGVERGLIHSFVAI